MDLTETHKFTLFFKSPLTGAVLFLRQYRIASSAYVDIADDGTHFYNMSNLIDVFKNEDELSAVNRPCASVHHVHNFDMIAGQELISWLRERELINGDLQARLRYLGIREVINTLQFDNMFTVEVVLW